MLVSEKATGDHSQTHEWCWSLDRGMMELGGSPSIELQNLIHWMPYLLSLSEPVQREFESKELLHKNKKPQRRCNLKRTSLCQLSFHIKFNDLSSFLCMGKQYINIFLVWMSLFEWNVAFELGWACSCASSVKKKFLLLKRQQKSCHRREIPPVNITTIWN